MAEEAIDTGFTESSELLAEVEKLSDSGEWVVVRALSRGLITLSV